MQTIGNRYDKLYKRAITHKGYKEGREEWIKGNYLHVSKAILKSDFLPSDYAEEVDAEEAEKYGYITNDQYFVNNVQKQYGGAIKIIGFGFLMVLLGGLWGGGPDKFMFNFSIGKIIIIIITIIIAIIITCYLVYLQTSKWECIYDRLHQRVTIPPLFWGKNITMSFKTIQFAAGTGGDNGIGAFILKLVRPNKSYYTAGYSELGCYHDVSFFVWYMDKNRPLPPGNAFDAYRDKDFERRKAEGFPPPLYPSMVATPEATPEQQAEREQYWSDADYTQEVISYNGV